MIIVLQTCGEEEFPHQIIKDITEKVVYKSFKFL